MPRLFRRTLVDRNLLRLNTGVFMLHFVLMAAFIALPLVLERQLGFDRSAHWQLYLPAMVLSLLGMAVLMTVADRLGKLRLALALAIVSMAVALLLAGSGPALPLFFVGLWLFFTGFNALEALLPSQVSKTVYAGGKGTALGIYATFQFFGAFAGGTAGGFALAWGGTSAVLTLCAVVTLCWLPFALRLRAAATLASRVVRLPGVAQEAESLLLRLRNAPGVADMLVLEEEATVYLKVDTGQFDDRVLDQQAAPQSDLPGAAGNMA